VIRSLIAELAANVISDREARWRLLRSLPSHFSHMADSRANSQTPVKGTWRVGIEVHPATGPAPPPSNPARLQDQLRLQLQFIQNSCDLYDAGHQYEAVRIAVALRNLFFSSSEPKKLRFPSIALVRQLGAGQIDMWSAGLFPNASAANITDMGLELAPPAVFFVPKFDQHGLHKRRLGYWWAIEPIYILPKKGALTRCQLVLSVCNKDGGTHVDPELEAYYARMISGADFMQLHPQNLVWKDGERPPQADQIQVAKNAHYAALRQMGFEALRTPYFVEQLGGVDQAGDAIPPADVLGES